MGNGRMHSIVGMGLVTLLLVLVACASPPPAPPPDPVAGMASSTPAPPAEVRIDGAATAARQEDERRREEAERNRLVYEDIYFGPESYRLDQRAEELLRWKADWLRRHPEVAVIVEGYSDQRGGPAKNLLLGSKRAGAVMSFLLREGIPRERLTAVSYGEERLVASGRGEEVDAKNRRVRLTIRDTP
jgi:peptidoglycan-associated lipoprotein